MTPQKFQAKPVEIDAIQWDGTRACEEALRQWGNGAIEFEDSRAFVSTPESVALCERGHWIVKDETGCFSVCPDEIFKQKYEAL